MPQQTQIQGQLSQQARQFLESKVATGKYASEADVISDTLATIEAWEAEIHHYEQTVVLPAYEHCLAHPDSAVTAEQLEQQLLELDAADGL